MVGRQPGVAQTNVIEVRKMANRAKRVVKAKSFKAVHERRRKLGTKLLAFLYRWKRRYYLEDKGEEAVIADRNGE